MREKAIKLKLNQHNEEVKLLWKEFSEKRVSRVPVQMAGFDERFFIMNPEINVKGFTWEHLFNSADAIIEFRIQVYKWWRTIEKPFSDMEYPIDELPDRWGRCNPFFESAHELAVLGATLNYSKSNDNPDCSYLLSGAKKWNFENIKYDVDPEGNGVFGKSIKLWREVKKKCETLKVDGRTIEPPGLPWRLFGGDGPFSVACGLRGSDVMIDMYEDPVYYHSLMKWITGGVIARMRSTREFAAVELGRPNGLEDDFQVGDDSAAMLSPQAYTKFVLPYWRQICSVFAKPGTHRAAHMCGNAQHLFKIMVDELQTVSFDTGFPCNLGKAREELGPEIHLQGNITPALIHSGPISKIKGEILGILRSGVTKGRKFILKDGTNVPPCTPMQHLVECYYFAKEMGRYVDENDNVAAMFAEGQSIFPWKNYNR